MAPILVLLAIQRPFDGEDAVVAARRFLVRMGTRVRAFKSLVSQDGSSWKQKGRVWGVGFGLTSGGSFSVEVNEFGRVFYACRLPGENDASQRLTKSQAELLARRLMARVPDATPTRLRDLGQNEHGFCAATFEATVGGRRFFNLNPTYGYHLQFDDRGDLTWFGREDVLPPTPVRTPKIAQPEAMTLLEAIWNKQAQPWPYPRWVEAELGFYAAKGEAHARLVWHGEVFTKSGSAKSQFSTIDTMVDASDGKLIKADDR